MKKISLFIIVILSILLIFNSFNYIKAETFNINDVNLGQYNIYCRQGDSYIRYKGVGQLNYMYYYRDFENKEHKAFCLNLGVAGAEAGDYIVDANRLVDDPKIASILMHGSPYKSLQELGLNNEDEASFATQFAVWCYINNLDLNQITVYAPGNENVVNAIKNIYTAGMNAEYIADALVKIEKKGDYAVDKLDNRYYSQSYIIECNENVKDILINSMGIKDVLFVDNNNNIIDNFNGRNEFKVLIPRNSVNKNEDLLLNIRASSKQTSVMFGATTLSDRQNMALLVDPVNVRNFSTKLNVPYNPERLNIRKIDMDTGEPISNVKFKIETDDNRNLGEYITNELGVIELDIVKDLNYLYNGNLIITEIEVPEKYYIDKEKATKKVKIEYGKVIDVTFKNEKIKGKIKINKYSLEDNMYSGLKANSKLSGAKFEVRDEKGNLIEIIETNEEGVATTNVLLKGKYILKEIESPKYYLIDNEDFELEIKEHGVVVEKDIYNKNVQIDIEINKFGHIETQSGDKIFYDFKNIMNKSNVALSNFTWLDELPVDAVRIQEMYTGTYNEELEYNIAYKTNKSDFKIFKENLITTTNYKIDFNELQLAEDEYIESIELRFGTVQPNFREIETPRIYCNVLPNLKNGYIFKNRTSIRGDYLEKHINDEDEWETIIYKKSIVKTKELPKTRISNIDINI